MGTGDEPLASLMTRKRYRCGDCHRLFDYDHHPSIEADPVPCCAYDDCPSTVTPEPALVAPHIAKSIGANTDAMYRQMEAGSEVRAQHAMEMTGMDSTEVSGMKITDLADNLREGDSAEPSRPNPLGDQITANPGTLGFVQQGGAIAQGLEQSFIQGHHKNAGLNAMKQLRQVHNRTAAARVAAGTENRGAPPIASPQMTVDTPALETINPGYRRRG